MAEKANTAGPDRGKRLFVDPKSRTSEVILNWHGSPEDKLEFYGEAFHQAGQALAARYDGTGPDRDFAACPVVFLYRHALELYVKGFLLAGNQVLVIRGLPEVDRSKILSTHNLVDLLPDMQKVLDALDWSWDFGPDATKSEDEFRTLLLEFDRLDRNAHAFRYPMDKTGAPSLPSPFHFDLGEFCRALDPIIALFDGFIMGAEQAVETENEIRTASDY